MRIGYNLGPPLNKGTKAVERATLELIKEVAPDAEFKPYTSGYTDEVFDIHLCIGGDSIAYSNSAEFAVTRNAINNDIPTIGFGIDISPPLGKFTSVPPVILHCLKQMKKIFVLSAGSKALLNKYEIDSAVIPDLTWRLSPKEINYEVQDNTIAIAVYHPIQNIRDLIQSLIWELRAQGYNVIQLIETGRRIAMDDLDLTPINTTWEQNITILSKCKALITTGFHAAICGYKAGIPVMTLPVQEKTYWLAEELGLKKPLPFASLQAPRYVCNELNKLIENPPKIEIPKHNNTIELLRGLFHEFVPSIVRS